MSKCFSYEKDIKKEQFNKSKLCTECETAEIEKVRKFNEEFNKFWRKNTIQNLIFWGIFLIFSIACFVGIYIFGIYKGWILY